MSEEVVEFTPFPKIARLTREMVISEKLDGTNAQVVISEQGVVLAGSRTRFLAPGKKTDNFGFAQWVLENIEELRLLGPGRHFGEWYGKGIQRGYGLEDRRFALFNTGRWKSRHVEENPALLDPAAVFAPVCCHVVPTLYRGAMNTTASDLCIEGLKHYGSAAVPGFMDPEGIVVFHSASGQLFKKTVKGDEAPKGQAA